MTRKQELAIEIEQLKQQLREREREREERTMKWSFLVVDFVLTGIDL
jgi:hypothetical protein